MRAVSDKDTHRERERVAVRRLEGTSARVSNQSINQNYEKKKRKKEKRHAQAKEIT